MTQYLLAAEADKIQDLLFRSAKLREVAGGSQLLTRFCDKLPALLDVKKKDNIIVNDGGSFRILFDGQDEAIVFGERLAEVYRRATGGTLTVAEPVPVNGDFGKASEQAHKNLRRAKQWPGEVWQGQEHQPYIAFCASCGVGLAATRQSPHPDEDGQYLCASCRNKSGERYSREETRQSVKKQMGKFLAEFYEVVAQERGMKLEDIHWPGERKNLTIDEIDPLADVAEYAPRRYVAYIVADGNNMGQVFSACTKQEQMKALSEGLVKAVRQALAEPTRLLMQEHPGKLPGAKEKTFVPVYPLILGGDDIFVLLPARWALDFARRFAQKYEKRMKGLVERIGLNVAPPTISVAVVICKSKHPYTQAHAAGERRLKEAKRMGKRLTLNGDQAASTINFEVVLGGRLVEPLEQRDIRPTLRPYWAGEKNRDRDKSPAPDWGLPVQVLIEQREKLGEKDVPRKRLVELRDLYDDLPESLHGDAFENWKARLERLLRRIGRNKEHFEAVKGALEALGGEEEAYWREISRAAEDTWHGHGLPDLLEAWDFALRLDESPENEEAQ